MIAGGASFLILYLLARDSSMLTFPGSIFKYSKIDVYTIQNLDAKSIYFASPDQFNDPYDCTLNVTDYPPEH